jgi:ribosomal-protein-alanine N-acetyltransferase
MKTTRILTVRLLFPRDVRDLLAVQEKKRGPQWVRTDLLAAYDQPGTQAWAAEIDENIVGYLVFQTTPQGADLLHIAVAPYWRRQGIARAMLEKLADQGPKVRAIVPDTNLAAQLLLRDAGYKAVRVVRGHCGGEDGYRMVRKGS